MLLFNSRNAILKHELKEFFTGKLVRLVELQRAAASSGKSDHVPTDLLASFLQTSTAVEDAVVVDAREFCEKMMDSGDAVTTMTEDVYQWDEINFPFTSFIFLINDSTAIVGNEVVKDNTDDVTRYNFITVSNGLGEWATWGNYFQIQADNPSEYVCDPSYERLDEAKKSESQGIISADIHLLYAMLFMAEHGKAVEHHITVPEKLQKKRKKLNRPAYSEYKVLELGNYASAGPKPHQGGTHASPKMHIRRGHWRRRPHSSEKLWIKASVVGDPTRGIVIKDYKVKL